MTIEKILNQLEHEKWCHLHEAKLSNEQAIRAGHLEAAGTLSKAKQLLMSLIDQG